MPDTPNPSIPYAVLVIIFVFPVLFGVLAANRKRANCIWDEKRASRQITIASLLFAFAVLVSLRPAAITSPFGLLRMLVLWYGTKQMVLGIYRRKDLRKVESVETHR
jgi:hypothetical protein